MLPRLLYNNNNRVALSNGNIGMLLSWQAARFKATSTSTTTDAKLKSYSEIPGPPTYPLIGSMKYVIDHGGGKQIVKVWKDLKNEYGDLVRLQLMKSKGLVLYDPADVEKVQKAEGRNPVGSAGSLSLLKALFEKEGFLDSSLIYALDEKWRALRKELQKDIFPPAQAESFIPSFNVAVEDAVKQFPKYGDAMDDMLPRLTFELMTRLLFSKSMNLWTNPDPEDEKFMRSTMHALAMESETNYKFPFWKYLPSKFWNEYESHMGFVMKRGVHHVNQVIESFKNGNLTEEQKSCYVATLLRNEKIDNKQILVNAATFLFAGVDTTSVSMLWVLLHLARTPNVQEKLYQDLKATLGGGSLTVDALANLPYLRHVVKESARITPTAIGVTRAVAEDIELKGYHIPKGTNCIFAGIVIMNDPKIFENPTQFIPERWDEEHRAKRKAQGITVHDSPYSSLGFSVGPRMCVGARVANVEIYCLLARLVQDYKIELISQDGPLNPKVGLLYKPNPTPKFRFVPRK